MPSRLVLWPAVHQVLRDNPDVTVEFSIDHALTDIVAERFDAGVRLGEEIAKDMIAVKIGPDLRLAVGRFSNIFRRAWDADFAATI